jgi:hypothetical protein
MSYNPSSDVRSEIKGLAALVAALLLSGVIVIASQTYRETHPVPETTWSSHLSTM